RREELPLIGGRAQSEAPLPRGDVAPCRADLLPERLRALGVATRRRVVEPLDALVAGEADLLREDGLTRGDPTRRLQGALRVPPPLAPPGRRDRGAFRADQDVVVLPHRELPARERPPRRRALPGRHVRQMLPAPVRLVPRRIVDLGDRLRPRPANVGGTEV